MKSFLISDNKDTWVGMKLAGIDGVIVHTHEEVLRAIKTAVKNDEIGILIMTEKAVDQVREEVLKLKLQCNRPLIIEIPDRHGSSHSQDQITNYIRDSVGIRI
ncbi:MAG: V-type ATP synthase subunit F [Clostridiaceae bacterium]